MDRPSFLIFCLKVNSGLRSLAGLFILIIIVMRYIWYFANFSPLEVRFYKFFRLSCPGFRLGCSLKSVWFWGIGQFSGLAYCCCLISNLGSFSFIFENVRMNLDYDLLSEISGLQV
jgi:hypothetical protein